jgi:hypothetical protein
MNKSSKLILISGLLILSVAQILPRFISLLDYQKGIFMGIGIGLMLLSFTLNKQKIVNKCQK